MNLAAYLAYHALGRPRHPAIVTLRFTRELPKSGLGKILKDRLAATLEPLP